MNEERDTHFRGFAKLLYDDFLQLAREDTSSIGEIAAPDYVEKWRMKVEQLIAERAYDLVLHTVWNIAPVDLERLFMKEVAAKVPDFTEWPEYEK